MTITHRDSIDFFLTPFVLSLANGKLRFHKLQLCVCKTVCTWMRFISDINRENRTPTESKQTLHSVSYSLSSIIAMMLFIECATKWVMRSSIFSAFDSVEHEHQNKNTQQTHMK